MTSYRRLERPRTVAAWLLLVATLILAMVVVGGATRLTGSGLSITEWKPIMGAIPPLGHKAWLDAFAKYQKIPQYRLINPDMTLDGFKAIFWWEWSHRLLGRLLGLVFGAPLVVFLALRMVPRRLILRLIGLFLLGALQGFVGWWMVESGLETRVSVAPERLAIHLGLALLLYAATVWTALEAWAGQRPRGLAQGRWASAAALIAALAYVQCLLGALVAGNRAGLVDNDWPLMRGRVFPSDYWVLGWRGLIHGEATTQFDHRLVAYLLLALTLGVAVAAMRGRRAPAGVVALAAALAVMVIAQAALGISTLMLRVPLPLAMAHQAGAALVLAVAVAFAWRARRD